MFIAITFNIISFYQAEVLKLHYLCFFYIKKSKKKWKTYFLSHGLNDIKYKITSKTARRPNVYSNLHKNGSKMLLQRWFLRCVNVSGTSFLESLSKAWSKTLKEHCGKTLIQRMLNVSNVGQTLIKRFLNDRYDVQLNIL